MTGWSDIFPSASLFPLHPIVNGRCACGRDECPDVGKHPACLWSQIGPGEKWRAEHEGAVGYGIATGERSGVFVVDLDGAEGVANFAALGPCPATFTVGRGEGRHLYFTYPGYRVPNSRSALAPKVDVRGDGGYVVAPGSPHKSGDRYVIVNDVPPTPAPAWLLAWLQSRASKAADAQAYEGDIEPGPERDHRERLYREYLAHAPPSIAGKGGDAALWRAVQRGAFDAALPADVVLRCIREVFEPRCDPPWGTELERRVLHKVQCAKTQSERPALPPVPLDLFEVGATAWMIPDAPAQWFGDEAVEPVAEPLPDEVLALETELKVEWGNWDKDVPPPTYIVKDIVPDDTVGMVVAKGSSLKTWMALSIGIAVANGEPWLGHFEVKQGNVLILDFESGAWQLRHRARLLGAFSTPGLGHANFPGGRIDDPKLWTKVIKICRARNVRLLIVDSFAAGAPGVDENVAAAAMPCDLATKFSNATGAAAMFIHHAKKGEGGDERDLIRGTGAIYAALDWAVTMIPLDDDRTRMKVRNIKPWGPRPEDFQIQLTKDGALVLDVEAEKPSQAQEEVSLESKIRALLLSHGSIETVEGIRSRLGKSKQAVTNALSAMKKRREVIDLPGKGYTLDDQDKRMGRVRLVCELPCSSLVKLAKLAHVEGDELARWVAEGKLALSAEGRYIWVA